MTNPYLVRIEIDEHKFENLSSYDIKSTLNSMKVIQYFYEFAFKGANLKKIEEAKIGYGFFKKKALGLGIESSQLLKELNYLENRN